MQLSQYFRADNLVLILCSAVDPMREGTMGRVLAAIEANAGGLRPDRAGVGRGASGLFRPARVLDRLAKSKSALGEIIGLDQSGAPGASFGLRIIHDAPVGFRFELTVPAGYFAAGEHLASRVEELVQLTLALDEVTPLAYGLAHPRGDFQLGDDPFRTDPHQEKKVYEAYWLNVWGKEMVDALGRDRVMSAPASRLERLGSGGVLLFTRPTPLDWGADEGRRAQARLLAHVRGDDEESAFARLRARSEKILGEPHAFDPDVAPLLESLFSAFTYEEEAQRVAEFNRYKPPAVTEWRPLSALRAPDVDEADATEEYDLYAENLVALLHKSIPSMAKMTPESLTSIDYEMWLADYPGSFARKDIEESLVPAVGAYLGEVMAKNLGGKWVPQKSIDDSQLVIGDRAYLPFLRARHYLRDKNAALDFSLTQFYRVAARSRSEG